MELGSGFGFFIWALRKRRKRKKFELLSGFFLCLLTKSFVKLPLIQLWISGYYGQLSRVMLLLETSKQLGHEIQNPILSYFVCFSAGKQRLSDN